MNNIKNEVWVGIVEYENIYKVSNLGRVMKLDEFGYIKNYLKARPNKRGYLRVNLFKYGKGKDFYIHRLVAQNFISNFLNLPEVNHKDGDKGNNLYTNLEWVKHKDNMSHGYRTGLINNTGSNHPMAKLNEDKVREIKKMLLTNQYTDTYIGKIFDVSRRTINFIKNKKQWKHV